jgi:hypothetical protein
MSLAIDAILYGAHFDYSNLASVCEQVIASGASEVRVKCVLSETPLPALIAHLQQRKIFNLQTIVNTDQAISGIVSRKMGRHPERTVSGKFYLIKHPSHQFVWLLITDAGGEYLKYVIRPFLKGIHPRITVPVFRTPQIESMLVSLMQGEAVEWARIKQVGGRTRIHSEGAVKRYESDRKWTDKAIREVFDEAKELGQWITDVTAEFDVRQGGRGVIRIGRYGTLAFRGLLRRVFDPLVNQASAFAQERYTFLRDRARRSERAFEPRPFEIDFQFDALHTTEQFASLRTALHKIPRTTCTILHGNPYFHAVLADYTDGSVYEVLVLEASKLTVIPQGRSSVRALQRLGSYIFANFNEGEFVEISSV